MSPARSRRRPVPNRRSRDDVIKAAGAAVGIVVGTALLVWLMRPGPNGQPLGTGGLVNRQPRMSWLIVIALGVAAFAAWWILRVSRRVKGREKVALATAFGVVAIAAIIGGIVWPGGVLRHDHARPQAITPTVPSTTAPNGTVATTTGPAVTTTSTGTSGTGTTATSNPGGTAPTSNATTTTSTGTSTTAGP